MVRVHIQTFYPKQMDPHPDNMALWAYEKCNLIAAGLLPEVTETVQNARPSSTCSVYSSKW